MPEHRRDRRLRIAVNCAMAAGTALVVMTMVYPHPAANAELPNRIPEAAPYLTAEAQSFPPPFEESWQRINTRGNARPVMRASSTNGTGR